jgi:hypothetical protein
MMRYSPPPPTLLPPSRPFLGLFLMWLRMGVTQARPQLRLQLVGENAELRRQPRQLSRPPACGTCARTQHRPLHCSGLQTETRRLSVSSLAFRVRLRSYMCIHDICVAPRCCWFPWALFGRGCPTRRRQQGAQCRQPSLAPWCCCLGRDGDVCCQG